MAPDVFAPSFVPIFYGHFSVAPYPQGDVFLLNTHSKPLGVCIGFHSHPHF